MLKKYLIAFLLFVLPSFVHAQTVNLLFWYPGGEGDSEAAKPILEDFATALMKKVNNKFQIKVTYSQNSIDQSPVNFTKPQYQMAVIAYDTYLQIKDKLQNKLIAHTLSLPEGKPTEVYYLLALANSDISKLTGIYQNRPISEKFVKEQLFPELKNSQFAISTKNNLLGILKSLPQDPSKAVLIDAFAWNNIKKLSSDWAQRLKVLRVSQVVATAPLISLGVPSAETLELSKIMLSLKPEPVLNALRLAGFAAP